MKIQLVLTFLMISNIALGANSNCFSTHIKEAINKNIDRKPLYSKMTGGKSKFLSNLLITSEKATFVLAKIYDKRARDFQKGGVPILCLDYVDMDLTPEFSSVLDIPQLAYDELPKIDVKRIRKKLLKSLEKSFKEVGIDSEEALDQTRGTGHYNCMLTHVLESINRAALLAPHYEKAAADKNLKSPKKLLEKNIKIQIKSLGLWAYIDKKAAKFQEKGLKVICQDVPKINPPTEEEIDSIGL